MDDVDLLVDAVGDEQTPADRVVPDALGIAAAERVRLERGARVVGGADQVVGAGVHGPDAVRVVVRDVELARVRVEGGAGRLDVPRQRRPAAEQSAGGRRLEHVLARVDGHLLDLGVADHQAPPHRVVADAGGIRGGRRVERGLGHADQRRRGGRLDRRLPGRRRERGRPRQLDDVAASAPGGAGVRHEQAQHRGIVRLVAARREHHRARVGEGDRRDVVRRDRAPVEGELVEPAARRLEGEQVAAGGVERQPGQLGARQRPEIDAGMGGDDRRGRALRVGGGRREADDPSHEPVEDEHLAVRGIHRHAGDADGARRRGGEPGGAGGVEGPGGVAGHRVERPRRDVQHQQPLAVAVVGGRARIAHGQRQPRGGDRMVEPVHQLRDRRRPGRQDQEQVGAADVGDAGGADDAQPLGADPLLLAEPDAGSRPRRRPGERRGDGEHQDERQERGAGRGSRGARSRRSGGAAGEAKSLGHVHPLGRDPGAPGAASGARRHVRSDEGSASRPRTAHERSTHRPGRDARRR